MARASVTLTMETQTIEDHLMTLLEKLETIRETKETTSALSRYRRQPIQIEIRTLEFWRSIISECLATFFFVFIVCGAGLSYLNKGSDIVPNEMVLATALATGFSMAILNQCFGKISGGHVNPAVSLAMAATKKISPLRAAMFVIAQCGGGIAGAALLYGVNPPGPYPVAPALALGSWERFGVELVLTFIVVFTHCSTTDRKLFNNNSLVIGAAYTACTLVAMPMLNPARALGPAFVMNKLWDNHWVFWFGPVLGGIMAAVIFEFIFNSRRHSKRPKDSIDGDSSSIQSEDEAYDDGKYHPAAYRPVAPGNPTSPNGYCPSVASASAYNSAPPKSERVDSLYCGSKYGKQAGTDGIYSGSRSLYNGKVSEGIYSGAKSMYTKSPPLTRANLNRSQSVYSKAQNPRDILPKPGPLIPAQSLYPIKLGNGGHLNANIRDFGSPNTNFISGVKTNEGSFMKVNPNGGNFNQNTLNFLAGRNAGSKSYHDISDNGEKNAFLQPPTFNHVTNQNVQNQHLQNAKPDKNVVENIYGIRNNPTGGIYPGNETTRQEAPAKRDNYELVPRNETPRNQSSSNFSRTAAYVKSVQNNPGYKPRESNYDIVPSGIREVSNMNPKPHNRSETSDYGSNRSDTSIYGQNRSLELGTRPDTEQIGKIPEGSKKHERPERGELPPPPPPIEEKTENRTQKPQYPSLPNPQIAQCGPMASQNPQWNPQIPMRHIPTGNKPLMPEPNCNGLAPVPLGYLSPRNESRQSPLSSVSSNSFSRNSPNPPY